LFLARVVGTVVATVKYEGLEGAKLLLVSPLDKEGHVKAGAYVVACDEAQAGPGDTVFCVSAREASHALPVTFVPVDAAIVGIVDRADREVLR
jgi:ethanolamine utilization protein EutN